MKAIKPESPLIWLFRFNANIRIIVLLLSFGLFLLAPGLTAAPAKPDTSTPSGTVRAYFTAMQKGDAKEMDSLSFGPNSRKQWMAGFMRCCLAYEKLDQAATAKFGRENTDKAFGELKQSCPPVTTLLGGPDEL
jgi:hypothetical protein